jgi:diguanylate cyclase (GGDEF)-like protein
MAVLVKFILLAINLTVSIYIIYFGLRNRFSLSLVLQKWIAKFAILSATFFAVGEVFAIFDFLRGSVEFGLLTEIAETVFICCVAAMMYLLYETERREVVPLRCEADTDSLTSLYNHAHFMRVAQRRFEQAHKYRFPLSVIFLDIDDFKGYNDQFGHEAGNTALRSVAMELRESVRADDLLSRYGGEEFTVLITGDLENAIVTAERLRSNIEASCSPSNNPDFHCQVTVSIGVSQLTSNIETLQALIEAADNEMYRAKRTGKNRVCASESSEVIWTIIH